MNGIESIAGRQDTLILYTLKVEFPVTLLCLQFIEQVYGNLLYHF